MKQRDSLLILAGFAGLASLSVVACRLYKSQKSYSFRKWLWRTRRSGRTEDLVDARRVFPALQPELTEVIVSFLSENERVFFRLVCKAAANQFRGCNTVRLSEPVPPFAFAEKWSKPEAVHDMTLTQIGKLHSLTAASGSLPNLRTLLAREDNLFTAEVFTAAAKAGHIEVLRWLRRKAECPWSDEAAEAAAREGRLDVVKYLLAQEGYPYNPSRLLPAAAASGNIFVALWLLSKGAGHMSGRALRAAAAAGHEESALLLAELQPPERVGVGRLMAAVAQGCSLGCLQALHVEYAEGGAAARRPPGRAPGGALYGRIAAVLLAKHQLKLAKEAMEAEAEAKEEAKTEAEREAKEPEELEEAAGEEGQEACPVAVASADDGAAAAEVDAARAGSGADASTSVVGAGANASTRRAEEVALLPPSPMMVPLSADRGAAADAAAAARAAAAASAIAANTVAATFAVAAAAGWDTAAAAAAAGAAAAVPVPRGLAESDPEAAARVMAAAAASHTPDWMEKILWLESLGYPRCAAASERAAEAGGGPEAGGSSSSGRSSSGSSSNGSSGSNSRMPRSYSYSVGPVAACGSGRGTAGSGSATTNPSTSAASSAPAGAAGSSSKRRSAVTRLAWLHTRGFPMDAWTVAAAAKRGDEPAVRWLLREAGVELESDDFAPAWNAAAGGHLEVLQALAEAGCTLEPGEIIVQAARGGHLRVVAWLLNDAPAAIAAAAASAAAAAAGLDPATPPPHFSHAAVAAAHQPALTAELFAAASESGCEPLMRYLREVAGCPWDATAFAWAAWVGCQRTLGWLAAAGCPMGTDGEPYIWAGYNADYVTLRRLRALGCEWSAGTFNRAVCLDEGLGEEGDGDADWCCSLEVLRWFVDQGCPVDWPAALGVAVKRRSEEDDLLSWLLTQAAASMGIDFSGLQAGKDKEPGTEGGGGGGGGALSNATEVMAAALSGAAQHVSAEQAAALAAAAVAAVEAVGFVELVLPEEQAAGDEGGDEEGVLVELVEGAEAGVAAAVGDAGVGNGGVVAVVGGADAPADAGAEQQEEYDWALASVAVWDP